VYSILSDLPTDVEGATTACRRKWGGCTTRGTVQAAPGTSAPPRRYLDAHGPERRLRPRGRSDQALQHRGWDSTMSSGYAHSTSMFAISPFTYTAPKSLCHDITGSLKHVA